MTVTAQASSVEIAILQGEIEQTLMGAVKCKDAQAVKQVEVMKEVTVQEWQLAARALLISRKTSILDVLTNQGLEAVAFGAVDIRRSLFQVIQAADEHVAQRTVQEIAARRLNLRPNGSESEITKLEQSLVCDALLEAYAMGANSRSA